MLGDGSWIDARLGESPTVSQTLPNWRYAADAHIRHRGEGSNPHPKEKNKSRLTSPKLACRHMDGWRSSHFYDKALSLQDHVFHQLNYSTTALTLSPLLLGQIICSFIKLDNIPCVVGSRATPTVLSPQHFVLLAHYFTHALLFYQALLK